MKIAESILGSLAEPVLILDGSLRAVLANPSFHALLGVQRHELNGKKLHDLLGPFRAERRLESILQMVLAEERDMQEMELALELPQSAPKVLALTAQRVVFEESPAPLLLIELREITQEKEVDKYVEALNESLRLHGVELEEMNKELDSFTHSVSHDLRTPLLHRLLSVARPMSKTGTSSMIRFSSHSTARILSTLLLIGGLLPAYAVERISGVVTSVATGNPINLVDLDVFDSNGASVSITGGTSGAGGIYTLTLPGPGTYTIRADSSRAGGRVDQYYDHAFLPSLATPITVTTGQT